MIHVLFRSCLSNIQLLYMRFYVAIKSMLRAPYTPRGPMRACGGTSTSPTGVHIVAFS